MGTMKGGTDFLLYRSGEVFSVPNQAVIGARGQSAFGSNLRTGQLCG